MSSTSVTATEAMAQVEQVANSTSRILGVLGGLGIVRHRRAADAVLELAQAERVQAIVLGVRINPNLPRDYDKAETAEEEIFRRAECEVIVDREPVKG